VASIEDDIRYMRLLLEKQQMNGSYLAGGPLQGFGNTLTSLLHSAPNNGAEQHGLTRGLDSNSAAAGLPPSAVYRDYRPECGFRVMWDRLSGPLALPQTVVVVTTLGEYDCALPEHPDATTGELAVAAMGVRTGRSHRTVALTSMTHFRCVDVDARPTVYMVVEVYSVSPSNREELLGAACFYLFDDETAVVGGGGSGTSSQARSPLRAGCWRVDLIGDGGGSLQFRVSLVCAVVHLHNSSVVVRPVSAKAKVWIVVVVVVAVAVVVVIIAVFSERCPPPPTHTHTHSHHAHARTHVGRGRPSVGRFDAARAHTRDFVPRRPTCSTHARFPLASAPRRPSSISRRQTQKQGAQAKR
jgi:hypothetical protein